MSSLINSQHMFRQATRERGIIELKMRMIDVRCRSMESVATQATLIGGFAYGSLQPQVLDTLWDKHELHEPWYQYVYSFVFVMTAAASFASSMCALFTGGSSMEI